MTTAQAPTSNKIGPDVAEEIFKTICEEIGHDISKYSESEKNEATKERIIGALCSGQLDYKEGIFKLILIRPFKAGENTIKVMNIEEPDGIQLRAMAEVKKGTDDVGKAMAVLGAVTGLGLKMINKMKSRDLMVAVEVIGLFL